MVVVRLGSDADKAVTDVSTDRVTTQEKPCISSVDVACLPAVCWTLFFALRYN